MKIKDIVNREIVNLSNCDQEPIHIPGSIQPHGFLFALDNSFLIAYCSGNTESYLDIPYQKLLKSSFAALIGDSQFSQFITHLDTIGTAATAPLVIQLNEKKFNCITHRSDKMIVAEFEPLPGTQPAVASVYDQTIQFVKYMQESVTLKQLCDRIAREIRSLTGYDRVMVYRFDKDYNGEVYAEAVREDLEPFLGLHYPHTDIPAQARQLYIKNLLRIIVDVNYTPVPIYTIDDTPGKNLDMSFSVLRSTSPIHVQYLQNMGVGATLTISLLHEGKLWGLIACHHYKPKYIDHFTRINAQLQGHFLTSQINLRQEAEEYNLARDVNNALERILNKSYPPERNSIEAIIKEPALLALCNAAGVAIVLDDTIYTNGQTPAKDEIRQIAAWASPHSRNRLISTSKLSAEFEAAKAFCPNASGIIYYSLKSTKDACIIWFNPETLEEVNWAGDPEKSIEKNENGLSPRKSFESWKQVVKCQAREWKEPELNAAANYAYALQKHITYISLNEEENRQRELSNQLKESNAELENINWISTHDLKEPLRKIQVFSSKLLAEEKLGEGAGQAFQKINESAKRMQRLIEGLSMYARTRHSAEHFEDINLQEKLETMIKELEDDGTIKASSIKAVNLPTIKAIPILIQQLFMNLINNALKFSKKDVDPVIMIEGSEKEISFESGPGLYHIITVKDNGIGFPVEMNESVFKLFSRLNPVKLYEGSGIGLALCKKVMQLHNGHIKASGEQGVGAVFTLYFPSESKIQSPVK